jgi:hypothetical protein
MKKLIKVALLIILTLLLLTISLYAQANEVLNTEPKNNAEYVSLNSKIKAYFNGDRNKSDYNFTITPSLEGTISSYENAIIFTPNNSLKESTNYKITIKNNKDGSSYSWSFTTNSTSLPPAKEPSDEKLAGIALDDSVYTVLNLLGEPEEKTEPQMCQATAEILQHYIYTSKGIDISIDTARGTGTVSFITITAP